GKLFDVTLSSTKYTAADGDSFVRYGMKRFGIKAFVNRKGNYIDIDNYTFLVGTGSAISSPQIDATVEGGHSNHTTHSINISGKPQILSTNEGSSSNNTLEITNGTSVGNFLKNIYTVNTDAVRVYEDNTYAKLLLENDVMKAGNIVVAATEEKCFTYYTTVIAQSASEEIVYTTTDFAGFGNISKQTVYNGSSPIPPMVTNDAGLTEKISGGNGGKIKQDRVYTFNYDTTPKIEQLTSIFQTQSFTDNYSEFDFKLNDDNAQLILYYNYFTTSEHSNSANAAINQFLNISSNGIKVANDTNNLTNPNVTLVDSIEPSQWHRLGVFFSNTEDEVILYYDGVKYTIPVKDGSVMLKYGARAVRWQMKGSREVANVSIDNLYLDALPSGSIDYSSRIVKKPSLTSFNGDAVEGDWLTSAKGTTVGAFKAAIQFTDTTAVRIYKDASYSEDVTFNDSFILTSASKVVLSNNEQVFAYYNIGDKAEAENTAITSSALTVDGEYIHGYGENETAQSLVSKINLPFMASAAVCNANTAVADTAKVKAGMILRVTSADKTESKDYTICNGELFIGNAEYTLSGVTENATYENTSIGITVPVINYTDDVKALSILVARYNGEKLEKTNVYDKSVTARFDGSITQTHSDAGTYGKDVSYKVFVWEKSSIIPMMGSQLYSSALAGKTIAVFGDSISAPANGYVSMLANATGANVINGAVGGSRVLDRADTDSFGKYKLDLQNIVDGLITPGYDWSTQESYSSTTQNVLNYKKMNLSNTDAAIIWIGTNDYGTNIAITDFETAVKDVLDKLTSNYPNLKIVLASPIYRARWAGRDGRNSDAYPNTQGHYLREFCEVFEKLSKDYVNVTFLDLYNESGITKFSNEKYDYLEDGLHPYKGDNSRAYKNINAMFINELVKILK
ncbi:MAG: SGNH/GDSL hydrolase family protein, partial [Clostridia bacterium]|nr:SGNH/GDSL hydrolase family protein [Clostridia bacterium]